MAGHNITHGLKCIRVPYEIDKPVSAGDTITASVQYIGGNFIFTIRDSKWPTAFTITETPTYVTQRNSAEWIVESPSTRRDALLPLANFGSVTFSDTKASIGTETGSISSWSNIEIDMGNASGNPIAQTSGLNTSGTGFTVSYIDNNSNEPGITSTNPEGNGGLGSGYTNPTGGQSLGHQRKNDSEHDGENTYPW